MEQWVFMRHGNANTEGTLSPLGLIQAERRGLHIGIKHLSAIVTSESPLAMLTAQVFGKMDLTAKRIVLPELLPQSTMLEEAQALIGYSPLEEYHENEEVRKALTTYGAETAAKLRDALAGFEGFGLIVGHTPFLEQLGLSLLQQPESDFADDNFTNIGLVEAGAFVLELDSIGKVTRIDIYNEPIEG